MKYSEYLKRKKKMDRDSRVHLFYYKGKVFMDTFIAESLIEYDMKTYQSLKRKFKEVFGSYLTTTEHSKEFWDFLKGNFSHNRFIKFLCCLNRKKIKLPIDILKIIYDLVIIDSDNY